MIVEKTKAHTNTRGLLLKRPKHIDIRSINISALKIVPSVPTKHR